MTRTDLMKIDIRNLSEKAQRIFEQSDDGALEAIFGTCESIEDINEVAEASYAELLGEPRLYRVEFNPENYCYTGEWSQIDAYVEAESEDEAIELTKDSLRDQGDDPEQYVYRAKDVTEQYRPEVDA